MGVDYTIFSKKNKDLFKEDDPNQFLKYALMDIAWGEILDLLRINLGLLYDNSINYWCPEQVNDMYNMIKNINEDPYKLYDGWKKHELETHMIEDIQKAIKLKDDINKLCEYFKFLSDNECYISVS